MNESPNLKAAKLKSGRISATLASLIIVSYPVLFLFEKNPLEARIGDFLEVFGAAVALGVLLLACFTLVFRDIRRGALCVVFLSLSGLLYGPLVSWFDPDPFQPGLGLSRLRLTSTESLILPFYCLIVVIGLWLVTKLKPAALRGVTFLVFTFSLVLLSFPLFGLAIRGLKVWLLPPPYHSNLLESEYQGEPKQRPDIYYFILDGFGREDVVSEIYGMKEGSLAGYLRQKGFFVADKAYSNYPVTVLSLASSLNGTYLETLLHNVDRKSTDNGPLIRSIHHSGVVEKFKSLGYQIVTISSGYHPTELSNPDVTLEAGRMNNFGAAALGYIQFPGIRDLISYRLHASYRAMLLSNMEQAVEARNLSSPKFVFCHIISPHPPFVFSENGELVPPEKIFSWGDGDHYGTRDEYRKRYAAQVTYITSKIKTIVETLLQGNPTEPVIIIQGDHGPGSETYFQAPLKSNFHERLAILNAYHFPGRDYSQLYPEISPVNSFRVVMNTLLNQKLPILPDRSYFTGLKYPFDLTDVTDKREG